MTITIDSKDLAKVIATVVVHEKYRGEVLRFTAKELNRYKEILTKDLELKDDNLLSKVLTYDCILDLLQ